MKKPISLTRDFLLLSFLLIVIVPLGGCAFVHDAPQNDTTYAKAEMEGQVPKDQISELDKKYPPGYWKQKPLNIASKDRLNIGIKEFLTIIQQTNPLPDLGKPDLGKMVTEIFTTAFVQSEAFNIIERQQLEKVLNELELEQSGIIDPITTSKIGNISGVDVIITGSISQMGNNQRIDARAIEVSTGKAIIADALTPIFNNQNVNTRTVDARNIQLFAKRFVNRMIDRYYR